MVEKKYIFILILLTCINNQIKYNIFLDFLKMHALS